MTQDKTISVKIARAARRVLEKHGPDHVTIRRIARDVGITPMAIYHYYPSRDALLQSITNAEFDKLLEFFLARQRRAQPKNRLLTLMDGYIDYAFARPRIFDYVFSQPRPGARQYPEGFRSRQSPTLNPVADAIAAAMQSGELRPDDPWEIAMQLWSLAHGYLALYRAGRFNLTERQFRTLVRRAVGRVFDGLRS